jgi:hypothetical protein
VIAERVDDLARTAYEISPSRSPVATATPTT